MKSVITVPLPQRAYNIVIAPGGLDYLGAWMTGEAEAAAPLKLGKKVLLVSNPVVFGHYGQRAIASLEQAGFEVAHHLVPDGEQHKTLETLQTIYDAALAHRLERSSCLVALGGGVIGDMTGFAAATWMRGLAVVQVPTTLLAMVDASIGGKTGVNHPQGKNLIGAFHQPSLVLIDPQVLRSLPVREFRAAMAEVIKYGVIWDQGLFEALEACDRLDAIEHLSDDLLQMILTHSAQAKADVVAQDEREGNLRAILNYGHTVGHAVESLTGYTQVNHGEAVAIGMVAAGEVAVRLGWWSQDACDRQQRLIEKAGLPTRLPAELDLDAVLESLTADKKVKAGKVRFALPQGLGKAEITDQVTREVLRPVLEALR
ncbi:3-dehydroquinate synthase [Geitlerinema sp. PCC 7407]|uniref:3-dehydroquinate synthase n=1 Tax=Geitlerinema sp. PCC 7407 TaxID=1173025 RepID=UPI00029FE36A|nr:3-dehydroquinate synthase [Geitlerinema sp. PCC 7407]AFY66581.1 3-dehydroquinate synthase [Geitlerinema sp. PCC 7407]